MDQFLQDVMTGLSASPKYLHSKYFYDKKGDELFQQIMHSDDYYLTRCELEIFQQQSARLADFFTTHLGTFDVVELGAGDAMKSSFLLKELVHKKTGFTFFPVDISANIITLLQETLPMQIPGLQMKGMQGEYLEMLGKAGDLSGHSKLVLFLGSNIGNIPLNETHHFLSAIRDKLNPGDMLLIGFDLKKNPHIIRKAYNDSEGITSNFNLNLLHRINRELHADFDVANFEHYPSYDPTTGTCKSFLVSLVDQTVSIADKEFDFCKHECIQTEVSQKYTVKQSDEMGRHSGFDPVAHFYDSQEYFLEAVWKCV